MTLIFYCTVDLRSFALYHNNNLSAHYPIVLNGSLMYNVSWEINENDLVKTIYEVTHEGIFDIITLCKNL